MVKRHGEISPTNVFTRTYDCYNYSEPKDSIIKLFIKLYFKVTFQIEEGVGGDADGLVVRLYHREHGRRILTTTRTMVILTVLLLDFTMENTEGKDINYKDNLTPCVQLKKLLNGRIR